MNQSAWRCALTILCGVAVVSIGCSTRANLAEAPFVDDSAAKPESVPGGGTDEDVDEIIAAETEAVRVSYARGSANYVIAGEATATEPRPELKAIDPEPAGPPRLGGRGVGFPAPALSPVSGVATEPLGQPATTSVTAPAPAPTGAAPLTSSFETIDFDTNNAETSFLFIPPDSHAAVGPNHVVVVTNVVIRFHEKDGTLVHSDSLADLFSHAGPSTFTFDPKVVFDETAQRFVVVTLEQQDLPDNYSRAFLVVSDDANPIGTWYSLALQTEVNIQGNDHWLDYPGLAVDEEAVYLNGNMFRYSDCVQNCYGGVRLWTIEKGVSGGWFDGNSAVVHGPYNPYGVGIATTTQPAMIRSDPSVTYGSPGNDVGTFLVSYSGLSNGNDEFVQIVRMDDPIGTPTFVHEFLNVGNLEDFAVPLPEAPQSGTGITIDSGDQRALDAAWRGGDLYMVATIDPTSGGDAGEATAHWWELDTSTLSTVSVAATTLTGQGNLGGEDIASNAHTFFPSIDVNANGDFAIGYSASASSIFAGSYYSVREAGSGSFGAADTLRAGTDWYWRQFNGTRNRWGDYSGMVVDESTGCFWVYNQHAMTRGTITNASQDGRWRTAVGEICLDGDCLASTTVSGTITGSETHKATDITVTADVTGTGSLNLIGETIAIHNGASVAINGEMSVVHGCPSP